MKKLISVMLIVVLVALCLFGCKQDGANSSESTSKSPNYGEVDRVVTTKKYENTTLDSEAKKTSEKALNEMLNKAYKKDETVIAIVNGVKFTIQEKNIKIITSGGTNPNALNELVQSEIVRQYIEKTGFIKDPKAIYERNTGIIQELYNQSKTFVESRSDADLREMGMTREELAEVDMRHTEREVANHKFELGIVKRIVSGYDWDIEDAKLKKEYWKCVKLHKDVLNDTMGNMNKMKKDFKKQEEFKEQFIEYLCSKADIEILIDE